MNTLRNIGLEAAYCRLWNDVAPFGQDVAATDDDGNVQNTYTIGAAFVDAAGVPVVRVAGCRQPWPLDHLEILAEDLGPDPDDPIPFEPVAGEKGTE